MDSPAARPVVDTRIWGKLGAAPQAPYPLINHLLDSAAAAQVVWSRWLRPGLRDLLTEALAPGDPDAACALVSALTGLHDIGKANVVFQTQAWAKDHDGYRGDFHPGHQAALEQDGYNVTLPTTGRLGGELSPDGAAGKVVGRHEGISMLVVAGRWPGSFDPVADAWAPAVLGAHHGQYHPHDDALAQTLSAEHRSTERILRQFMDGRWGEQQRAHLDAVLEATGTTAAQLQHRLAAHHSVAVILLSGIVTLADWLASTSKAIATGRRAGSAVDDSKVWLETRRAWFDSYIEDTLGVYQPIVDPVTDVMGKHAHSMSDLQKQALDVGAGLWVVAVPAGDGKTEAALLRHATLPEQEGLLLALPTRAMTDAMWARVRRFFHRTKNYAALLHGHARLNSFYSGADTDAAVEHIDNCGHDAGLTPNDWLSGTSRSLLAPLSVSTCDQVLAASLRQRRSFLRLLAVANRHLVLDEVHTYDTYQATLLAELLTFLSATRTNVTLLSASLPTHRLKQFTTAYARAAPDGAIYPGTTTARAGHVEQTSVTSRRSFDLSYRIHETRAENLENAHTNLARRYRSASENARIGVVVNQVDRCINVGRQLSNLGEDVTVFHSRMTAGHRAEISGRLTELLGPESATGGVTVVGTQVIEASLDIDFDCMVSDLAPAASLVQRSGRLWRHSQPTNGTWEHVRPRRGASPVIDVVAALDDHAASGLSPIARYPYLMAELKRTLAALRARGGTLSIPDDVQALVDAAAITAEDLDNEMNLAEADIDDEYREDFRRLRKAASVVIHFRGHGFHEPILDEEMSFETLSAITTRAEADDASTRFIDQDQQTFLLLSADGQTPYAWHGTADDAAEVRGGADANALLSATFTMSLSRRRQMPGLIDAIAMDDWKPANAMFKQVQPVFLLDPTDYDPLLGLVAGMC
jgi:CRISPR-associated endonuclease/helicase Cas3